MLALLVALLAGSPPNPPQSRVGVLGFARDAPDRVLIASNETGTFQLSSFDPKSGQMRRLTQTAAGKASGTISPDGRWVYYLRDEGGSEVGKYVRVPFEGGRAEEIDAASSPASGLGIAVETQGRFLVEGLSDADGFRYRRLEDGKPPVTLYRSPHEAYGPALSADGRFLAIVETERKNDRHYATLILDARTGERVAEMWDGDGFSVTHGPWSPRDGDERIVLHSDKSGFFRPEIYDVGNRTRTILPVEVPGDVTGEDWSHRADGVLLRQHHSGRDALFQFDLARQRSSAVKTPAGNIAACWIRPDGKVWAQFQSSTESPRLLEIDPASGTSRTLVASREPRGGAPLELVMLAGARGDAVSAYLAVPHRSRANGAGIVWIHGGPHSEVTDASAPLFQAYVDAGFAVLAPNYHGSSGAGREFASSIEGNPMSLELEDFAAARRFLIDLGFAPTGRVFAVGWSYGGFAVLSCLTRQPGDWAGGSAGAAVADWKMQFEDARGPLRGWTVSLFGGGPAQKPDLYRDRSPIERAGAIRAPLVIFQGRKDSRTSARQIAAFLRKLDEEKKPYEIHWYDTGHNPLDSGEQADHVLKTIEFFRKIMGSHSERRR
ncbi:MAG: S9 family peptidase [Thermoanaerobaculia bacterium]